MFINDFNKLDVQKLTIHRLHALWTAIILEIMLKEDYLAPPKNLHRRSSFLLKPHQNVNCIIHLAHLTNQYHFSLTTMKGIIN